MYLLLSVFENIYRMEREPDYEPAPQKSVAAMAKARGISPAEMSYELLLEDEGLALLFVPFSNFADNNMDAALEMLRDPNSVDGLGEGGSNYGQHGRASCRDRVCQSV